MKPSAIAMAIETIESVAGARLTSVRRAGAKARFYVFLTRTRTRPDNSPRTERNRAAAGPSDGGERREASLRHSRATCSDTCGAIDDPVGEGVHLFELGIDGRDRRHEVGAGFGCRCYRARSGCRGRCRVLWQLAPSRGRATLGANSPGDPTTRSVSE